MLIGDTISRCMYVIRTRSKYRNYVSTKNRIKYQKCHIYAIRISIFMMTLRNTEL